MRVAAALPPGPQGRREPEAVLQRLVRGEVVVAACRPGPGRPPTRRRAPARRRSRRASSRATWKAGAVIGSRREAARCRCAARRRRRGRARSRAARRWPVADQGTEGSKSTSLPRPGPPGGWRPATRRRRAESACCAPASERVRLVHEVVAHDRADARAGGERRGPTCRRSRRRTPPLVGEEGAPRGEHGGTVSRMPPGSQREAPPSSVAHAGRAVPPERRRPTRAGRPSRRARRASRPRRPDGGRRST